MAFPSKHKITITDQVGDISLRHHGDSFLTDTFIQHGIKGAAPKQLNTCQLFLQVETLSDITTADERYILGWALDGCPDPHRPVYHAWPTQGDPGWQAWTEWRRTLSTCFCSGQLTHGLLHSLGQWITKAPFDWQWWYSLSEERIYRCLDGEWHYYLVRRTGRQTRLQRFIYGGPVDAKDVAIHH